MYNVVVYTRPRALESIRKLYRTHPVVAILGPRQIGKTTLAKLYAQSVRGPHHRFDLEDPDDLSRLSEPMLALGSLQGLVILDEIQRRPELFPVLRVLVDRPRPRTRFLVLGSAAPELLRQTSETLAGRIAYHELSGLHLSEVGVNRLERLWMRGGFPRAFLARSETDSFTWRQEFIRTFLERDIPQFGLRLPAPTLRRFWSMVAHHHGQIWNGSELGASLGLSDTTVRGYLDVLTSTFMVRQLLPWHENLGKRQVKSPKIYLTDTGLLHALIGVDRLQALTAHPKLGASWEGLLISQVLAQLDARSEECFFWATHQGAELDLLVVRGNRRWGFEFKRTSAPEVTKSMRVACADLRLDRLDVIHAGEHTFPLSEGIRAVAAVRLLEDLAPLK